MERVAQESFITVTATLRLNEPELRMLDVLARFDADAVTRALAESLTSQMGGSICSTGMSSLLEMVSKEVRPILRRTDAAREAFKA